MELPSAGGAMRMAGWATAPAALEDPDTEDERVDNDLLTPVPVLLY